MSLEDTKTAAIAETGPDARDALVAPVEFTERPRKPVSDKLEFSQIYDSVGRIKGLRVRPRNGTLIEYVDMLDLDHRKKCRVSIRTAPSRGRPRKFAERG